MKTHTPATITARAKTAPANDQPNKSPKVVEDVSWIRDYPIPAHASLTLWSEDLENCQEVQLSIAEYYEVKEYLINVGKIPGRQNYQWLELMSDGLDGYYDARENLASYVETARELYRQFPALVVSQEPPAGLVELLSKSR